MAKNIAVEIKEPNGDVSYFSSISECARALGIDRLKIANGLLEGLIMIPGTRTEIRVVPFQPLAKSCHYQNLQVRVEYNYAIGFDALAEDRGMTAGALLRECILKCFSEEDLWERAKKSPAFQSETFRPMRLPNPRRIPFKKRQKIKKRRLTPRVNVNG